MRGAGQSGVWRGESVDDGEPPEGDSQDYDSKKPRRSYRGGQHGQPVFDFYQSDPNRQRRNSNRDEIYEAAPAGPPKPKKGKSIEAL